MPRPTHKRKADEIDYEDPMSFVYDYCRRHNLPRDPGDSNAEKHCAQRATDAREEYKQKRDAAADGTNIAPSENGKSNAHGPVATTSSANNPSGVSEDRVDRRGLSPAQKYSIRLQNNRKSAYASKVYAEVLKRELSARLMNIDNVEKEPSDDNNKPCKKCTEMDDKARQKIEGIRSEFHDQIYAMQQRMNSLQRDLDDERRHHASSKEENLRLQSIIATLQSVKQQPQQQPQNDSNQSKKRKTESHSSSDDDDDSQATRQPDTEDAKPSLASDSIPSSSQKESPPLPETLGSNIAFQSQPDSQLLTLSQPQSQLESQPPLDSQLPPIESQSQREPEAQPETQREAEPESQPESQTETIPPPNVENDEEDRHPTPKSSSTDTLRNHEQSSSSLPTDSLPPASLTNTPVKAERQLAYEGNISSQTPSFSQRFSSSRSLNNFSPPALQGSPSDARGDFHSGLTCTQSQTDDAGEKGQQLMRNLPSSGGIPVHFMCSQPSQQEAFKSSLGSEDMHISSVGADDMYLNSQGTTNSLTNATNSKSAKATSS